MAFPCISSSDGPLLEVVVPNILVQKNKWKHQLLGSSQETNSAVHAAWCAVEAHAAMPHFSDAELGRMERLRKAGDVPQMILHKVQRTRRLRGVAGPTQSAVYR